jgi:hypothetical protein
VLRREVRPQADRDAAVLGVEKTVFCGSGGGTAAGGAAGCAAAGRAVPRTSARTASERFIGISLE